MLAAAPDGFAHPNHNHAGKDRVVPGVTESGGDAQQGSSRAVLHILNPATSCNLSQLPFTLFAGLRTPR